MSKALKKIQVIGLGQACLDCLARVPSYPPENEKVELTDIQFQCGGPASTAMVTLSRLDIPVAFIGSISDDPYGIEILKGLKTERIETTSHHRPDTVKNEHRQCDDAPEGLRLRRIVHVSREPVSKMRLQSSWSGDGGRR